MKNWITIIGLFIFGTAMALTPETHHPVNNGSYYDGQSYIFVEQGIEFSVFPDGQFDFVYVGPQNGASATFSWYTPGVNISFNSGYNYDMYVQYDDYGAIVQVENVPVYYDHYGRIVQAGNVEILYNDRRIVRVGGMNIYYNNFGYYSHFTGYISPYYTTYIYRPWHVYYVQPVYASCVVYSYPYRRYYSPVRYDYAYHHRNYNRGRRNYTNGRRDFYRPGSMVHHRDGRVARNANYRSERTRSDRKLGRTNPRNESNSRPMVADRGDRPNTDRPKTDRYEKPRVNRNEKPKVTRTDKGRPSNNNATVYRGLPKDRSTKTDRASKTRSTRSDRGGMATTQRNNKPKGSFNNGSQRGIALNKTKQRGSMQKASKTRSNNNKATKSRSNSGKKQNKQSTRSRRGL